MSKAILVKPDKHDFNYASVDEETAKKLEYFANSGKALYRKHQIQFTADFGKLLSEARDLLSNHKNGTFIKWAEAEFDLSAKTIYNYVNAWQNILCNGYTIYSNWSQTALYLAAADDFPKPVLKKLEKIPPTDLVRACDVKRLIEAAKPKPEPEPEPEDEPSNEDGVTSEEEWSDDTTLEVVDADDSDVPFDAPDEDSEEFPEDETMEQICQRETSEIESWARKFGDMLKEAQKALAGVPTLDELNARDGWERKLKEALSTLRGTKPVVCPICQGDGTEKCPCGGHGRITKRTHGQMV